MIVPGEVTVARDALSEMAKDIERAHARAEKYRKDGEHEIAYRMLEEVLIGLRTDLLRHGGIIR